MCISRLFCSGNARFAESDAFIGFQKDTPASVIFQATNLFVSLCLAAQKGCDVTVGQWADILKWSKTKPAEVTEKGQSALVRGEAVSVRSVTDPCRSNCRFNVFNTSRAC